MEIARETKPFQLLFKNFGAFKPKVVYIHVEPNEQLTRLYRSWRTAIEQQFPHLLHRYPERPYHPHLTLAHRDVGPEQFSAIWKNYEKKEFTLSVEINSFWFLDHEKAGWRPVVEFKCDGLQRLKAKKF
jgi:2'-5' RNA ligase